MSSLPHPERHTYTEEHDKYVYLAGPITGLLFDEAADWRAELELPEGWIGLSPMRDKEQFRIAGPLPSTFDEGAEAVQQDLSDIRRASAVIVNLAETQIASVGSCAEIGYAYARGKPIIVVLSDPQVQHVPGEWISAPNPHDHVFVHEMASYVVDTLDEALLILGSEELRPKSANSEVAAIGR